MQQPLGPVTTGATVMGIKYDGGVLLMTDTLVSYGSMARFKNVCRFHAVNKGALIGVSGEYADFQSLQRTLDSYAIKDFCADDGNEMSASEVQGLLSRYMYGKRNRQSPLWCSILVAGSSDNSSTLGFVDMYGSSYYDNVLASGFGAYLAIPLLRKYWKPGMTLEQAEELLKQAMLVCLYRDCRTINKFRFAHVDSTGVVIGEPFSLDTKWDYKLFKDPEVRQ